MKCKLCENEFMKLATSHIFPKGFFSKLPSQASIRSYNAKGSGNKLISGLYDKEILCSDCENITMKYDDYAIKIFRCRKNSLRIKINKTNDALVVYEDIDTRLLRGFLASLLWRISASNRKELKNLTIGEHYFNLIRDELIKDGKFNFIDVFVFFVTSKLHSVFNAPKNIFLEPIDIARDPQTVNGWQIEMPNIIFRVSLDTRYNPQSHYWEIPSDVTGKSNNIKISTSLNAKKFGYEFVVIETTEVIGIIENLQSMMRSYMKYRKNKWSKNHEWLQSHKTENW